MSDERQQALGRERVSVELERTAGGGTRLVVADDGKGFDTAVTRPGLGLLGMRERSEALGGTFKVDAQRPRACASRSSCRRELEVRR